MFVFPMWYRCLCVAHNSSIGEYVRSCTSSALIGVVSNVYLDAECFWGISFDISLNNIVLYTKVDSNLSAFTNND